jgi:hypothetical protein
MRLPQPMGTMLTMVSPQLSWLMRIMLTPTKISPTTLPRIRRRNFSIITIVLLR